MIACGVRSSCEAFAAKRRSSSIGALYPVEHRVEGVGEIGQLVAAAGQRDAVVERAVAAPARGIGDAVQRPQHDAGEQPSADETEHHQQPAIAHQAYRTKTSSRFERFGASRRSTGSDAPFGHEAQQQEAHDEQRDPGDDEEVPRSSGELDRGPTAREARRLSRHGRRSRLVDAVTR